jgi:single-strand DNA-binding protein
MLHGHHAIGLGRRVPESFWLSRTRAPIVATSFRAAWRPSRARGIPWSRKDPRMAGSVNKVILIGNLGKDPEVRSFQNGGRVCNLRLATTESWKDKATGERKDRTEWHSVAIFNDNLVTIAERYLKKGSKVYIEGQLETRKYTDKDGNERYSTEVVLRQFRGELTLLDGRSGGSGGGGGGGMGDAGGYDDAGGGMSSPAPSGGRAAARPRKGDMDDDIPF